MNAPDPQVDLAASPGLRYLQGNLAPTAEERTILEDELRVTGTIPSELDGRYLRNGPNPVNDVDQQHHHWFLGDGMVHGVRLEGGRAHWYRNRFVRTPQTAAALNETPFDTGVAADRAPGVANTNVIGRAGRTWAIVEGGGCAIELTDELDTIGLSDFDGTLPSAYSAHPKMDPVTGKLHTIAYTWTMGPVVQYLVQDTNARVEYVQNIELAHGQSPMMHELSITATKAVLYDLPCVFSMDIAMEGWPFPYRWKPELGARVGLLPINGGDVVWCELDEPRYVFHSYTAFDAPDGTVVMDCVVHPSMFGRDFNGPDDGQPVVERWTINPTTRRVTRVQVSDRPCEFPRVDERLVGRAARFGYASQIGKSWNHGPLLRTDFVDGTTREISHGTGRGTMETVFVPRTETSGEDDGWLMSMVHDANTSATDLVILDAGEPWSSPVATVHIPARVPFGFHGNWVPTGL